MGHNSKSARNLAGTPGDGGDLVDDSGGDSKAGTLVGTVDNSGKATHDHFMGGARRGTVTHPIP